MKRFLLLFLLITSTSIFAQEITAFQHLSSDVLPNSTSDLTDSDIFNRGSQEPQAPITMPFFSTSTLTAISLGTVGSVAFELTGPLNHSSVDNTAPFALFENFGETFETRRFPEGAYTITATPYSDADTQGTPGESFSISFTVLDYDWVVYSGRILDTTTDQELLFYNYQTFQPTIGDDWLKEINFEAFPAGGIPEYVHFELDGPDGTLTVNDFTAPYTLFGDDNDSDYFGQVLAPGNYSLRAIPYDSNNSFRPSNLFFSLNFTVPDLAKTYVPDNNFEQALIDLGYDDVLDDYVLTKNIENVSNLNVSQQNISNLTGIEDFVKLENLKCFSNSLKTLDIASLLSLKSLECGANPLESLDVTQNVMLERLVIGLTSIGGLDLSQNVNLKILSATDDAIPVFDLNKNVLLELVVIGGRSVVELDISEIVQIKSLGVFDSKISFLDVSHLSALEKLQVVNNEFLSCIQVDDVEEALATPDWRIDDFTSYSLDCSSTQDADFDGVEDSLDICPNTPPNQPVNASGCALSQLADLAVQNIGLRIGSQPCSEAPSAFAAISVKKNVPIHISITRDGTPYYNGIATLDSPAILFELPEAEYRMCVTNDMVLGYEQCFDVFYSRAANSVATTLVIQNPGQTYTMTIGGSTRYEVVVNGSTTTYEFEDTVEQQITIPLEVGINDITINGILDCGTGTDTVDLVVESEEIDKIVLFPTVTTGKITIDNNQRHQIASISVTSISGNRLALKAFHDNPAQIELDISGGSEGMYIVQITKMSGESELIKVMLDK